MIVKHTVENVLGAIRALMLTLHALVAAELVVTKNVIVECEPNVVGLVDALAKGSFEVTTVHMILAS